jgi:geranylgeranyl pyrophosphate synthase
MAILNGSHSGVFHDSLGGSRGDSPDMRRLERRKRLRTPLRAAVPTAIATINRRMATPYPEDVMNGQNQSNDLNVEAMRGIVRQSLRAAYAELGFARPLASTLADLGRVNRGVIVYSIGAADRQGETALLLAASTELMHRASVIIDDIEDEDTLRRGQPCLHVLVGQRRALAISDLLLSASLARFRALGARYLNEVINAYADMAKGQAIDVGAVEFKGTRLDEPAMLKTGSLIRMCFRLGALVANFTEKEVTLYGDIGMHLGCVFQLQNDMDNFTGRDPRNLTVRSDVARGNVNSIVLAARVSGLLDEPAASRALRKVETSRVSHFTAARKILESRELTVPATLQQVIYDFAVGSRFVADQVEPAE